MEEHRYLGVDEIKKLLSLPWHELNQELNQMDKDNLKSIIAYASGHYQVTHKE